MQFPIPKFHKKYNKPTNKTSYKDSSFCLLGFSLNLKIEIYNAIKYGYKNGL